jgi:hypothetical protein
LLLAGEQNFRVVLNLPVQVKGLPADLQVANPENPRVRVTFEGLRKNASTLNSYGVRAVIDCSHARPGQETFEISAGKILFPRSASVRIINIEPQEIEFTFNKKS